MKPIKSRQDLKMYLVEDMRANLGFTNNLKYYIYLLCCQNGAMAYCYLKSLRKYEYALNCYPSNLFGKLGVLWRKIRNKQLGYKYAITIHPNTVGYGLYLPHTAMGGVVINCKIMGNYCTVNTGCLIGKKNKNQNMTPTFGDNVTLNPGACVIGEIEIGNNVIIAPHAVVTKNVPSNAIVAGVPAKIIRIYE